MSVKRFSYYLLWAAALLWGSLGQAQQQVNKDVLVKRLSQRRASTSTPITVSAMPLPGTRGEEVVLRNGDRFSGKIVGYEPQKGLIWNHPSIRSPLAINLADVGRIFLKHEEPSPKAKKHKGKVNLLGGGSLIGDLLVLNEKELVLDTWYAGQMKLPRNMLAGLFPGTADARVVYEGPARDDGWMTGDRNAALQNKMIKLGEPDEIKPAAPNTKPSSGRWLFKDNSFESTGSNGLLARKFKLPDRLNLEFDLTWAGSPSFNIGVHLYGNRFDQYQSNAYSIRLDPNYCYVYRMTRNGGTASLGGNVRSKLTISKKGARISIRVDRTKKTFTVLVDGVQIGNWRESGSFVGKSDGLMFVARSSYRVSVSRIRLTEWDGRLPTAQLAGDAKDDYVRFTNEDHMSGKVAGIKEAKLFLKTPFQEDPLELDLDRVGFIQFAKLGGDSVKGPASFYLERGGRLEGKLLAWRPDGVEVDLLGLGKTVLASKSILAIQFK